MIPPLCAVRYRSSARGSGTADVENKTPPPGEVHVAPLANRDRYTLRPLHTPNGADLCTTSSRREPQGKYREQVQCGVELNRASGSD